MGSRITVIIPAHNEAAVIGRTLQALMADADPGELRVIVVANGCTDATGEVARGMPGVEVIETDVPSKTNALNLGDAAAGDDFPRFYVDGDVVIKGRDLKLLARELDTPGVLAVSPVPRFDLSQSSWAVRAHHRIWTQLPFFRSGMIGSGVFGTSAKGRRRFGGYPQVIADDAFFKLQFAAGERVVVPTCGATVRSPRTLWDLIKIKTRSHLGNVQLRQQFPHLFNGQPPERGPGLVHLARDPRRWLDIAVYVLAKTITRYRVRQQVKAGRFSHWERDESSRLTR